MLNSQSPVSKVDPKIFRRILRWIAYSLFYMLAGLVLISLRIVRHAPADPLDTTLSDLAINNPFFAASLSSIVLLAFVGEWVTHGLDCAIVAFLSILMWGAMASAVGSLATEVYGSTSAVILMIVTSAISWRVAIMWYKVARTRPK